ncbi:hypothetical protein BHM03_00031280 [Ensete ventricosum]|nr:hypothetical protein BHM03_00031280 [Ensete ventricosum]
MQSCTHSSLNTLAFNFHTPRANLGIGRTTLGTHPSTEAFLQDLTDDPSKPLGSPNSRSHGRVTHYIPTEPPQILQFNSDDPVHVGQTILSSTPSTVVTSASATDGTNEISTDLPTSVDTVVATLISFLLSEQRNPGRLPNLQPCQRSGTLAPTVSGPANAALANAPGCCCLLPTHSRSKQIGLTLLPVAIVACYFSIPESCGVPHLFQPLTPFWTLYLQHQAAATLLAALKSDSNADTTGASPGTNHCLSCPLPLTHSAYGELKSNRQNRKYRKNASKGVTNFSPTSTGPSPSLSPLHSPHFNTVVQPRCPPSMLQQQVVCQLCDKVDHSAKVCRSRPRLPPPLLRLETGEAAGISLLRLKKECQGYDNSISARWEIGADLVGSVGSGGRCRDSRWTGVHDKICTRLEAVKTCCRLTAIREFALSKLL